MADDLIHIERRISNMQADIRTLKDLIIYKLDAAIKPKWVSKEVAMSVTGLCQRSLMDETIMRGGNINVNQAGKSYRYYMPDLEKYVFKNSSLPGGSLTKNKLKKAS